MPNFGTDEDIKNTQAHTKLAETNLKHTWEPKQDANGVWLVPEALNSMPYSHPQDPARFVQIDDNLLQLNSDPICSSAGCGYASEKGSAGHPLNYFVPNFGVDKDIKHNWSSLDWAENYLKHKWNYVKDNSKPPPKDYPVPDFGLDEDVVTTQANIGKAESKLKHSWVPTKDEDGVWQVPEAIDNRSYTYTGAGRHAYKEESAKFAQIAQNVEDADLVQLQSDPMCSSAGCTYPTKPASHPKDYFVPNFGPDHLIHQSHESLDWAEKNLQHKWIVDPESLKKGPGDPKDYFVPNFGVDQDIQDTHDNIKLAEGSTGHVWVPVQDENGVWMVPEAADNRSYTHVENGRHAYREESAKFLQLDAETQSDPICSSAGCGYKSAAAKPSHPMDYYVPNFGADKDINHNWASLEWAENSLGHKWHYEPPTGPPKPAFEDHRIPDFGLEDDIVDSQHNEQATEKVLEHEWVPKQDENGVWIVPQAIDNRSYTHEDDGRHAYKEEAAKFIQIDESSDPICSSAAAGCPGEKQAASHPKDYFVPNFGVDHDIIHTQDHIKQQEELQGHVWVPQQDENGVWIVPEAADNRSYTHVEDGRHAYREESAKFVQIASDPICSSAAANCPSEVTAKSHPKDYFVPNFGVDHDILHTQEHIRQQESRLDHEWVPEQDENGVWIVPEAADNRSYTHVEDGRHAYREESAKFAQLSSDPISGSLGHPKSKAQKDAEGRVIMYPNPDTMKLEHDIEHSIGHEKLASDQLKHKWTWNANPEV